MENNQLKRLYQEIRKIERFIGGGEGYIGIYGSLTQASTKTVLDLLDCQHSTCIVDVGAGIGRFLYHALVGYNVCKVIGIEIDPVKIQKGLHMLNLLDGKGFLLKHKICFSQGDIENISLDSYKNGNVLYCCWEGFPISSKRATGEKFKLSHHMKKVAIVQRHLRKECPIDYMHNLNFGVLKLTHGPFPVKMTGGKMQLQVYIFEKNQL